MAHHPLVTTTSRQPRAYIPQGAGPASPTENHMHTAIAITAAIAGVTGIALGIWHGWKARRR